MQTIQVKLKPEYEDGIPRIGGRLIYANQVHTLNLEISGVQKDLDFYVNKGAIEVVGGSKPDSEPDPVSDPPVKLPSTPATAPPSTPPQAPKVKNQNQEAAKKDAVKPDPELENPDVPPNPPEASQQGDVPAQAPEKPEKEIKPENPDKKGNGK